MQSAMASEEGCVTMTWEIKNFDLLLKEDLFDSLLSPAWKIEETKGKKKDGLSDAWTVSVREVPCVEGGISSVSCSMKACNGINLVKGAMDVTDLEGYTRFIMMPDKDLNIALQLELMIAYHRVCQGQLALHSPTKIAGHKNVSGEGSCSLGRDFLHLYREGMLSDVTLHAEDPRRSFSAHRSILAARSPVFRAIFEESSGGQSVDMDGVDSETVGRMLVYLYGHSLEDLGWREASALYCAADKYGVVRLKEKCAAILEACLTADNARDMLVLADGCSDKALVERVVLFILDHEEVVSSAQWEELERDNSALAAKIVKQLFLRRGKRMRVA
ncbi:hypothetical protein JTE90_027705 [Oedothorax gibbosus]|uniref:BTB domain-containing protein n=1 Tax=Oedothorax gibbosus TaxID=931172 RepID=A0AAV6UWU0_9ARAC|nr:hypothetical protein JTE90_027705 [Oedothorax gibbosus]